MIQTFEIRIDCYYHYSTNKTVVEWIRKNGQVKEWETKGERWMMVVAWWVKVSVMMGSDKEGTE